MCAGEDGHEPLHGFGLVERDGFAGIVFGCPGGGGSVMNLCPIVIVTALGTLDGASPALVHEDVGAKRLCTLEERLTAQPEQLGSINRICAHKGVVDF